MTDSSHSSAPPRRFAVTGTPGGPNSKEFSESVAGSLENRGMVRVEDPEQADFVLLLFPTDSPSPFRRRSRGTYVAAMHERSEMPSDPLAAEYPLLVRALANSVLCYVPDEAVLVTTPERGTFRADAPAAELAERLVDRIQPLATSRLVIDNEYRTDLEPELWQGDELTKELS